jgi:ribosomal protein S27AE
MLEVNSKCPKCGEGIMKLPTEHNQLPNIRPLGRVQCTKCGYEDDAMISAHRRA